MNDLSQSLHNVLESVFRGSMQLFGFVNMAASRSFCTIRSHSHNFKQHTVKQPMTHMHICPINQRLFPRDTLNLKKNIGQDHGKALTSRSIRPASAPSSPRSIFNVGFAGTALPPWRAVFEGNQPWDCAFHDCSFKV